MKPVAVDEVREMFLKIIQTVVPEFWIELDRVRQAEVPFETWRHRFHVSDSWLTAVVSDTLRRWESTAPNFDDDQQQWFASPVLYAPFSPDIPVFGYGSETLGEYAARVRESVDEQLRAWIRQKRDCGFGMFERDSFVRQRDATATALYQFRGVRYVEITAGCAAQWQGHYNEQTCRKGVGRFAQQIGLTLRKADKEIVDLCTRHNCPR